MSTPLITVAQLRAVLEEVTVLDVRYRMGGPSGPQEYAEGHVPAASYVDLGDDLAGPPGDGRRGRHPLPGPGRFVAAMRRAGVRNDRPVVVYDDWGGRAAARCWWLLRDYGHPGVRVLDGGWSAWAANEEVQAGMAPATAGDFAGTPGAMPVLDSADVLHFDGILVDARAPERYRGEVEPVDPVAGHIPGAVNVPTDANLREDGTFRSPGELSAAYPSGQVAAYCGSGVTATHDLLALAVAGREGVLYPGSWSEWVADPEHPVQAGSPTP